MQNFKEHGRHAAACVPCVQSCLFAGNGWLDVIVNVWWWCGRRGGGGAGKLLYKSYVLCSCQVCAGQNELLIYEILQKPPKTPQNLKFLRIYLCEIGFCTTKYDKYSQNLMSFLLFSMFLRFLFGGAFQPNFTGPFAGNSWRLQDPYSLGHKSHTNTTFRWQPQAPLLFGHVNICEHY